MTGSINIKKMALSQRKGIRKRGSGSFALVMAAVILLFLWIGLALHSFGQQAASGPLTPEEMYRQFFEQKSLLSYGKDYKFYYPRTEGTHLLNDDQAQDVLTYDGIQYQNLALNYDVYNDLLFVNLKLDAELKSIILDRHKIDNFRIGSSNFIHLKQAPDSIMSEGIYHVAFEHGDLRLWVDIHRERIKVPMNTMGSKLYKFVEMNAYFLSISEKVYQVKNKKEVLELLGNDPDLKKFAKDRRLKLSPKHKEFLDDLIRLLHYYVRDSKNPPGN